MVFMKRRKTSVRWLCDEKPTAMRHVGDRAARVMQQIASPGNALFNHIAMRRLSRGLLEGDKEVIGTQARHLGQGLE